LPATQASAAVTADGENWFLLNASPDLRQQINENPQLHPKNGVRHSIIAGAVLTNGDIDAVAGLLNLREGTPFTIYAHDRVLRVLRDNSIFNVLNPAIVRRLAIELGESVSLELPDGRSSGLEIEAFAVPGKVALYLEDEAAGPGFGTREGDTVGLRISEPETGNYLFFVAACAAMTPDLEARVRGAPLVIFDGTVWEDEEMVKAGLGAKTGQRMGHISMSGADGSIAAFRDLGVRHKVFMHINNSNPALSSDSAERAELEEAGWEVPADGTEMTV
jgi:pyrroloquinoline quinone biosynthesis protein B